MDIQSSILAALIPHSQGEKSEADAAFSTAMQLRLSADLFTGYHKFLFETIAKQSVRKNTLDREILETYLNSSEYDDDGKTKVRILFTTCRESSVDVDKLRSLIPMFIEQHGSKELGAILTDTAKILMEGAHVGKADLKGFEAAKQYLIKHVSGIVGVSSSPQGLVSGSFDKFWENYQKAKSSPDYGIKSGIRELDAATGGARNGELFTVAGFAKEGKSQILRNWAYNAVVRQHKNVVYASLEMSKDELMNLFTSLHSTNPIFKNTDGVKAFPISDGKLTPEDEARLQEVTEEWENNPSYGMLYILQMPTGSTVPMLRNALTSLQSIFPLDALFLDYASLLYPETRMDTTTMQVTSIYKSLKDLALTFNNGNGLPVITAHQTSRAKREAVDKSENKRYDMGYLSDASEVERSSDMVAWILRTEELKASREIKMGMSYFRRGRTPPDWRCSEYYDCSAIRNLGQVASGFGSGPSPSTDPSIAPGTKTDFTHDL
ncbi:Uncharacterised protein [uncultured archaeon]|nr:Uncharacterised protein [uncultured archaeon]